MPTIETAIGLILFFIATTIILRRMKRQMIEDEIKDLESLQGRAADPLREPLSRKTPGMTDEQKSTLERKFRGGLQ